jgi:hypothetical protein
MNSKRYRSQLAETTDDDLRYEFLRLLAQEGRLHFMRQIAESKINDSAAPNAVPGLPQQGGN